MDQTSYSYTKDTKNKASLTLETIMQLDNTISPQYYTNYCIHQDCMIPLTPQDIKFHMKKHLDNGTMPEIESIDIVKNMCQEIMTQAINKMQEENMKITSELAIYKLNTPAQIAIKNLQNSKSKVIKVIEEYFENIEKELLKKLDDCPLNFYEHITKADNLIFQIISYCSQAQNLLNNLNSNDTFLKAINLIMKHDFSKHYNNFKFEWQLIHALLDEGKSNVIINDSYLDSFKMQLEKYVSLTTANSNKDGESHDKQSRSSYSNIKAVNQAFRDDIICDIKENLILNNGDSYSSTLLAQKPVNDNSLALGLDNNYSATLINNYSSTILPNNYSIASNIENPIEISSTLTTKNIYDSSDSNEVGGNGSVNGFIGNGDCGIGQESTNSIQYTSSSLNTNKLFGLYYHQDLDNNKIKGELTNINIQDNYLVGYGHTNEYGSKDSNTYQNSSEYKTSTIYCSSDKLREDKLCVMNKVKKIKYYNPFNNNAQKSSLQQSQQYNNGK